MPIEIDNPEKSWLLSIISLRSSLLILSIIVA